MRPAGIRIQQDTGDALGTLTLAMVGGSNGLRSWTVRSVVDGSSPTHFNRRIIAAAVSLSDVDIEGLG